jgi:hypothetical protein
MISTLGYRTTNVHPLVGDNIIFYKRTEEKAYCAPNCSKNSTVVLQPTGIMRQAAFIWVLKNPRRKLHSKLVLPLVRISRDTQVTLHTRFVFHDLEGWL